jgi:hypothetical protein
MCLNRVAEGLAGVLGGGAELLFDAQDLVVLGEALGAARRARLDLAGGQPDHEVGDEGVLGLTGPVTVTILKSSFPRTMVSQTLQMHNFIKKVSYE